MAGESRPTDNNSLLNFLNFSGVILLRILEIDKDIKSY